MDTIKRFWSRVNKTEGCWEWTGRINQSGYGVIDIGNGSPKRAHRISYEIKYGPIKDGSFFVCHKCDNRKCVRPDHLFLGTNSDNVKDMVSKNRQKKGPCHAIRGENNPASKLTRKEVEEIRIKYAVGDSSQAALGKEYKVGQKVIWSIVNFKTWK